jgi:hypothetical protein
MLTAKVRMPDGSEFVKEVSSVEYNPTERMGFRGIILLGSKESDETKIFEGDVFVMNESGKTIADYHLHIPEKGVI